MARPKQKLKETDKTGLKRESFTKLFASAQNLPVAGEPSQARLSKLTSPAELHAKRSIETPPVENTKSLMATVPSPPPVHFEKTRVRRQKNSRDSLSSGWFLLVPAIGLTTFILLSPNGETPPLKLHERPLVGYETPEFRENVDFHRKETGWKMNRERIAVDSENRLGAPPLPASVAPVAKPDILNGLPLAGERDQRQVDDEAKPIQPGYPDVDVANRIRKEQEAIEFDKAARSEFIRELKENAKNAGYEVQVDADGNALFKRIRRRPSSHIESETAAGRDED